MVIVDPFEDTEKARKNRENIERMRREEAEKLRKLEGTSTKYHKKKTPKRVSV